MTPFTPFTAVMTPFTPGLNQRQIGRHYGKITSMAVCMARRRFREDQAQQDPALQKRLARLEEEILAQG